jgi:predicted nucleic acid-binding protein
MIYALDSNIISYLIRNNETVCTRYYNAVSGGSRCVIPLMVYYEVRRGLLANDAHQRMRSFENLCADLGVDNLTVADMNTAAEIYAARKQNGVGIDDADLLIAAQSITRGYILVTHNARHFDDIDGLTIEDWAE